MTTKQQMNAFASWLCAQEGLNKQISIGDAREIWRVLAIELIGNSERVWHDDLLYMSHPFLTAMIERGLKRSDGNACSLRKLPKCKVPREKKTRFETLRDDNRKRWGAGRKKR